MGKVRHEDTEFILNMAEMCIQRMRRNKHIGKEKRTQAVYLDESYCHTHHSRSHFLYHTEDSPHVNKPPEIGLRVIMIATGTKEGWVKNMELEMYDS